MKIPVLTYHSTNIGGNEYYNNDHLAFELDLKLFKKLNIEIISAHKLIQWMQGKKDLDHRKKYVVLTFDDGCELDFCDWTHPEFGLQKSFYTAMQEYEGYIHATAFVIASPVVRKTLEKTCLDGHEIWGDDWWQPAEDSGLITIENHSWDHLHITLTHVQQQDNLKGDFSKIMTLEDADLQIAQATDFINNKINKNSTKLFAYPYGHHNNYLVEKYFPTSQKSIISAFTCEADYVSQKTNLWKIPRYVCGCHWKNIHQLEDLIL